MKKIARLMTALALMAFAFTSCEDVPSPFGSVAPPSKDPGTEIEAKGSGTLADPYNVQAAIDFVKELGADVESPSQVYIKGYIVSISEISAQYGNASFVMSDDVDGTNKFTAYRVKGFNNQKVTDEEMIKVGDEVVVCGKIVYFKGSTPETVQNSSYIYSVNGESSGGSGGGGETKAEAKGTGTQADPYNVSGVLQYISTLGSDTNSPSEVYIKGKVKEITEQFGTQYGNATFTMIDEGFTTTFTAYRILYLGNKKYTSGDLLKENDDVIVCGKVVNFRGNTPETAQNSAYLYSLNGKTEGTGGGGGGDVTPGTPSGTGTEADPFNVAAAVAKCNEVGTTPSTESYYIKGIADADYTVSSYKNVEISIVDTEGSSEKFKVYRVKDKEGKGIKEGYKIAKGATIIVYGPVVNYQGSIPETASGAYLVSVNGQAPELDDGTSGGGDSSQGGGGGEVSGNTITVTFSSLGFTNQQKLTTVNLTDGTTLTFDGGGNSNSPAYFTSGAALRMYPKNSMTINAGSKKIAGIEIVCIENSGTLCNASGDVTVGETNMTVDGSSLKFTGPNTSTATVTNTSTTTGAASQIRTSSIKITYAE